MRDSKPVSIREAKANFAASLDGIHPLKTAMERPLLTLGLAVAAGLITGCAGTRILKKVFSIPALPLLVLKKLL